MSADAARRGGVSYPRIGSASSLAFCGYVLIWYLQIGYRVPALGEMRFEFWYAALLTAVSILCTPKLDVDSSLLGYVALYVLAILIQVPFSYDFATSWKVFVDRIIKFAFMSFFIVSFVRSPNDLRFFLGSFLLAALKMGEEGMLGSLSGSLLWENQGIMRLHGATPSYEHPNSFSGMAVGTLPFVYYLWGQAKWPVRVVLLAIGIFSLNIVVLSGSRTGYIGFLALLASLVWKSEEVASALRRVTVMVVLLLVLAPAQYMERFESIFTQQDKEGHSTEMRKQILRDAQQVFLEHPMGIGVSAFPKMRMDKFGRSQDTHNLYLEIATNTGIQGLAAFSMLIYKMLSVLNGVSARARKKARELRKCADGAGTAGDMEFVAAAANATGAFLMVRLALGLFGMDLYEIYWWFAIGITLSLSSMMKVADRANCLPREDTAHAPR